MSAFNCESDYFESEAGRKAALNELNNFAAHAQWGRVGEMLGQILAQSNCLDFRAQALAVGVLAATRMRKLSLAMTRYELLNESGNSRIALNARADAVFYLAEYFLPDQPGKLLPIWKDGFYEGLPLHAQQIYVHIGSLLFRQFAKNSDSENALVVGHTMRKNLGEQLWQETAIQLKRIYCLDDKLSEWLNFCLN